MSLRHHTQLSDGATGHDDIHPWLLRNAGPVAKDAMLRLFNFSWSLGRFPDTWKLAVTVPILKPGKSAADPLSYRPISLLPCIGKLMERLVYERLYWWLEHNNMLSQEQSGFRREHDTVGQLLRLVTSARDGFNKGEFTLAAFLDATQAFDRVWHDGLRYKLATHYRLSGNILRWLSDFIDNRRACTHVDGATSRLHHHGLGTPQGSTLSALLFIAYIDDVVD